MSKDKRENQDGCWAVLQFPILSIARKLLQPLHNPRADALQSDFWQSRCYGSDSVLRFLFFLSGNMQKRKNLPMLVLKKVEQPFRFAFPFCLNDYINGLLHLGRIVPELLFCNVTIRVSQKRYRGKAVLWEPSSWENTGCKTSANNNSEINEQSGKY